MENSLNLSKDYPYEVAFSFCKEDESIALKINDLIIDRLSTFIYCQKQEELVGTDGEIEFKKVFSEKARMVVVLYRNGYGKSPWTRIEEEAIRNRAYSDGFDFTLFVMMELKCLPPKYLPVTRIYWDLVRFGYDGIAAVILNKVREMGGIARDESVQSRSDRYKRKLDFEKRLKLYYQTGEAVQDAKIEYIQIQKLFKETAEASFIGLQFNVHSDYNIIWLGYDTFRLRIQWKYSFPNTLDESLLTIDIVTRDKNQWEYEKWISHWTLTCSFTKNENWEPVWEAKDLKKNLDSYSLIEDIFKKFFDFLDGRKDSGKKMVRIF